MGFLHWRATIETDDKLDAFIAEVNERFEKMEKENAELLKQIKELTDKIKDK